MEMIYLDQAAGSFPKAPGVASAVCDCLEHGSSNINRSSHILSIRSELQVMAVREALADLFGCAGCEWILFTPGATQSINLILRGSLRPGDHVIISGMEHNAVFRTVVDLEKRGVSFSVVPCDCAGRLDLSAARSLFRPETRLVMMTHASNVSGTILDLPAMGELCQAQGVSFAVDAAQTAGHIPVSLGTLRADAICFAGHKGLMGPQGIGGIALSPGFARQLSPLITGGTGSASDSPEMPDTLPDRFEAGTLNLPGIAGLRAGLLWLRETGMERVLAHELELTGRFLAGLNALDPERSRFCPVGRPDLTGRVGVVSVRTGPADPARVAALLDEDYGIVTRVGLHCAPAAHRTLGTLPAGTVRFSFGWQNTPEEVDRALAALEELMGRPGWSPMDQREERGR